jgi:hypothetical protein
MPVVLAFPKLKVCLECRLGEFPIPERELRVLEEGESTAEKPPNDDKAQDGDA